jgi:hypothetical protein
LATPTVVANVRHLTRCRHHYAGTLQKVIKKCGMSTTEVRKIKAGSHDALGDGILGLLSGASLMITKNITQSLDIARILSRMIADL